MKDRVRTTNRIKAFLQLHGITYPDRFIEVQTHWSKAYINWLEGIQLEKLNGSIRINILPGSKQQFQF